MRRSTGAVVAVVVGLLAGWIAGAGVVGVVHGLDHALAEDPLAVGQGACRRRTDQRCQGEDADAGSGEGDLEDAVHDVPRCVPAPHHAGGAKNSRAMPSG